MVFVPMAQAPCKAGANELSYNSLDLIHKFTIVSNRSDLCRFACENLPTKVGKARHWTSVFCCGWASNSRDSPKASPRVVFKCKSLIELLKLLSQ